MAKRLTPPAAFQSLRIIGTRAQKFLQDLRERSRVPAPNGDVELKPGPHKREVTIDVSLRSTLTGGLAVLLSIAAVLLVIQLRDKLVLLFLAVFVAAILDPGVRFLARFRIPRGVAVALQYIFVLVFLGFLIVSLIPILADQLQQLANFFTVSLNAYLEHPTIGLPFISDDMNIRLTRLLQGSIQQLSLTDITASLGRAGQSLSLAAQGSLNLAARVAGSLVEFVVSSMLVMGLAFFMQLEKEKIIFWLRSLLPASSRQYVDDKSMAIQWRLAQWIRGQLLLCLSVWLLVLLGLTALRLPYALTLSLFAGLCELIPGVGMLIAAIPTLLVASTQQSPVYALAVFGIYYIIQMCETHLLAPHLIRQAVHLSPMAVLFGMLVGVSLPSIIHPLIGVILAIPSTTIAAIFLEDWQQRHRYKRQVY